MRTQVKICGITRAQDAKLACELGADAIGVIFVPQSKRCVSIEQARVVLDAVPAKVNCVALFMDADAAIVANTIKQLAQINTLQFHGSESSEYCAQFGLPYWKAIAMGSLESAAKQMQAHPSAAAFVLDSHAAGQAGGTGVQFDWSQIPQNISQPIIVAGGLNPDNVADAIAQTSPWAVDVSGGVESAPGTKDQHKLEQFFQEIARACAKN